MDLPQDASWLQSHAMACVSQSFSSTADILRACCLHLQVIIGLLTRQRHSGGSVHLLAVLLEVVVGLGGDIVVLEVLLAVEGDGLGLDLAVLHVDLVAAEDDGNVLADTDEVTVPVGDVLVGNARCDVEHDDTALSVDVVTIAETTELLLTSGVPDIELDLTVVGGEAKGVDFDTQGGHVLLLEFTSQVTLDEGGLSSTTITDKHKLESGSLLLSHLDDWLYRSDGMGRLM